MKSQALQDLEKRMAELEALLQPQQQRLDILQAGLDTYGTDSIDAGKALIEMAQIRRLMRPVLNQLAQLQQQANNQQVRDDIIARTHANIERTQADKATQQAADNQQAAQAMYDTAYELWKKENFGSGDGFHEAWPKIKEAMITDKVTSKLRERIAAADLVGRFIAALNSKTS